MIKNMRLLWGVARTQTNRPRYYGNDIDPSIISKTDSYIQKSSLICRRASVSSDQVLATSIGMDILKKGGNAADAAVAAAAAISVIQPSSCGIGGDAQCMFYRNRDRAVFAINGSGRTPKKATLLKLKEAGLKDPWERKHVGLWVGIPGAVAATFDMVRNFGSGKLSMEDILSPVITLAEEGVPIQPKEALNWNHFLNVVKTSRNGGDMLVDGQAPKVGDIYKSPKLAQCLRKIARDGPEAFYGGDVALRMAEAVRRASGVLTLEDLSDHLAGLPTTPSSAGAVAADFNGFRLWQMRPNTIGIVALVALNVLKGFDLKALGHNSSEYIHLMSEAIKLAYLACWDNLCDPAFSSRPLEELLTEETANTIRSKMNLEKVSPGNVCPSGGNTTLVTAVDEEGNGCSLIWSLADFFGSGVIPDDCGFVLHNRPKFMSLDEHSPNAFGPRKLPLHSLIPSLVTGASDGELLAALGVIGCWIQPQGLLQVFLNMVVFSMDPQAALNQPRFYVGKHDYPDKYKDTLVPTLCLEGSMDAAVIPHLESRGHKCVRLFGQELVCTGKGHVIARPALFGRTARSDTWWSGADPRSDGCAMGY